MVGLSLSSTAIKISFALLLLSVGVGSVSSMEIGDNVLTQRLLQLNSNVIILNDGSVYTINGQFNDKSFHVRGTKMIIENGAEISATENWPAIRLVTSSTLNMTGGSVQGWQDEPAVELHNGQSSDETASFAEIYDGSIIGGRSSEGAGGDALYVHGFGTNAKIFGGNFVGGIGEDDEIDGLSLSVQNFASVEIHSGDFQGEIEVGTGSNIVFYGCFLQRGSTIIGSFVDGIELDVVVKPKNGGTVSLIAVSEQECDTQPSMQPTGFPTISPRPTQPQISYGEIMARPTLVSLSTLLAVLLIGLIEKLP